MMSSSEEEPQTTSARKDAEGDSATQEGLGEVRYSLTYSLTH